MKMSPFKFCTLCLCLLAAYQVTISQAKVVDATLTTKEQNFDFPIVPEDSITPTGITSFLIKQFLRQAHKLWPIIRGNIKSFRNRHSKNKSPSHPQRSSKHTKAPKHENSPKNENHPNNEKTPKDEENLKNTHHTKDAENLKDTKSGDHKNSQKNEESPKDNKLSDKDKTQNKDSTSNHKEVGHVTTLGPMSNEDYVANEIIDKVFNNQNQNPEDDDQNSSEDQKSTSSSENPHNENNSAAEENAKKNSPDNDSTKISFINDSPSINQNESPEERSFGFENFKDKQNFFADKTYSDEHDFSLLSPSENLLSNLIYSNNDGGLFGIDSSANDNSLPLIPSETVDRPTQNSLENSVFMKNQFENSWENNDLMNDEFKNRIEYTGENNDFMNDEFNNRIEYPIMNQSPQEFGDGSYEPFNLKFNRF